MDALFGAGGGVSAGAAFAAAGDTVTNFEAYYLTNSADSFTNAGAGGYIYGFGTPALGPVPPTAPGYLPTTVSHAAKSTPTSAFNAKVSRNPAWPVIFFP